MSNPESTELMADELMSHPTIQVRAVSEESTMLTFLLDGQICYQSVPALQSFLLAQFSRHTPPRMMLDMGKVTFVDSQGLALLIALHRACAAQGSKLTLRGASPHVSNLIKLTRLDRFIELL
jgi:anti-sigma B factor antagonist